MHKVMSSTLGSSDTLVKSPSASIAFLIRVFSQEMHVLVPQSETALNISGFLLIAKYGYYTEYGWDFKTKVC
jgi:hypothetical protein